MEQLTFSFFGLGLIGGSIARAIRASHPYCFIRACDTDSSTLRLDLEEGVIDEASERIDEENGMTFTAVSYTHLDVYKRQVFVLLLFCREMQKICHGKCAEIPVGGNRGYHSAM